MPANTERSISTIQQLKKVNRDVQEKVKENSEAGLRATALQNKNCGTIMKHLEARYDELPFLCDKSQTAGAPQPKTGRET